MINNIRSKGIAFLSLLVIFTLPAFVMAANPIGTVFSASGQVYAKQKTAAARGLRQRSSIFLQDTIIAKDNGRAQIKLADGTLLSIKPNTEFLIEEFKYNKKTAQKRKLVGKLFKGTLVGLSNQGSKADYQLEGSMTKIILHDNAGVVFRVLKHQENVGLFAGKISVQSKNKTKVLSNFKHNNYQAVVIKPNGAIDSYKGALIQPIPIPAGTVYSMSEKKSEELKSIYNMLRKPTS